MHKIRTLFGIPVGIPVGISVPVAASLLALLPTLACQGPDWGGSCFVAGTPILTPHGAVPIEAIRVGSQVYSYDVHSGQIVVGLVTTIFHHPPQRIGRLQLADGNALQVTYDHPIYHAESGQFVKAETLRTGDRLLYFRPQAGDRCSLLTLEGPLQELAAPAAVYNFTVEHYHTYFAAGVLVHNKSPICDDNSALRIAINNPLTGRVVSHPDGVDCQRELCNLSVSSCTGTPAPSELYAIPSPPATFFTWSGACTGQAPCVIPKSFPPEFKVSAEFRICLPNAFCPKYRIGGTHGNDNTLRWQGLWRDVQNPLMLVGAGSAVYEFDGQEFEIRFTNQKPLTSVWGVSGNDLRFTGEQGAIARWDGSNLKDEISGTNQTLYGMWGSGPSDIWTVGAQGTLLHYNGFIWTKSTLGTKADLYGVWGNAKDDVWIVGAKGTTFHWQGTTWTPVDSGTMEDLRSVWSHDASPVWAVGTQGAILRWNGTTWTAIPGVTSQDLFQIRGLAGDDVWAVGSGGTILHYTAATWVPMRSNTEQTLYSVHVQDLSNVYAAGSDLLLVYRP